MAHSKGALANLLARIDLGSAVAEHDHLLETARVETSVFGDILRDRVDLVPGTKGSGKSALYRIIVEFLAPHLLAQRQVVVAHGVQAHGDDVFMAFQERFESLSESQLVDFWCIYLVSLANEQFIKRPAVAHLLTGATTEVDDFKSVCAAARIPEIRARRTLREIIEWVLNAVPRPRTARYVGPDGGRYELDLFNNEQVTTPVTAQAATDPLPAYLGRITEALDRVLERTDLRLWLMVDRLDELFPRRSDVETRALRALLRTIRVFRSDRIRVKVFLRDDILNQITDHPEGFTALTHVTSRQAETLKWSEDNILSLIVNRVFASDDLAAYLHVDRDRLAGSRDYRQQCFYEVFPRTVYSPPNQSPTLRWVYSHCMDGNGVVTPRDVIELLTRAKQWQETDFRDDPDGQTDVIIGSQAIRHGHESMSRYKRTTVLQAEFPHLWPYIERFVRQKTEYTERAVRQLLGAGSITALEDLVSIGVLQVSRRSGRTTYRIPFLYRGGLEVTQGTME